MMVKSRLCLALLLVADHGHAFLVPSTKTCSFQKTIQQQPLQRSLFELQRRAPIVSRGLHLSNNQQDEEEVPAAAALPPSSSSANSDSDDLNNNDDVLASLGNVGSTASMAMMISQENKRFLIEELGYRRADVDRLKFDLAPALVEKRIRCPSQIPEEWFRSQSELDQENTMLQKLENESKYPFKVPLLGISLILFGKGFADAFITIIKVNMDFPGASLVEEFLGVPVLLIDAGCVLLGASLGWWTWNTMK